MVNITKNGQTITIKHEYKEINFPASSVCAHADKGSDSVDIKLKASRKTILSFNYKDINPTMGSAEEAVEYIANLV